MRVVRHHNFCSLDASVPSGSRRRAVVIEPTGALTPFPRDFSHTAPARACLSPKLVLAWQAPYREVAEHGENIEHRGFAGAVPADDQLLGGRLELEVYEAAIVGRV